MKKILLKIVIVLVVLVIVCILVVSLFLDGAVKRGVETIGPRITKVDIKLDSVSLSVLSGAGSFKGLVVGNPPDFKTPHSISIGRASVALKPASILGDKVVINSIVLDAPEITFEGGFGGNNLSKILSNVQSPGGGTTNAAAPKPEEKGGGKKLQVDDFLISGAKLNVSVTGMGGKTIPVALPEIHLTDLGKGPDGITPAELTKLVLQRIEQEAVKAADKAMSDMGKGSLNLQGLAGTNANGTVGRALDLLKKK